MDDSEEPSIMEKSLLEYARHHGIATDHQAVDPFDLVVASREAGDIDTDLAEPKDAPDLDFSVYQDEIESNLRNEKLEMSKGAAKFLSSVLNDLASAKHAAILETEWDKCLAKYPRTTDLKVNSPLLTAERDKEMVTFGKRPEINTLLSDLLPPRENDQATNDEGLEFPDDFWGLSDDLWADIKTEKLDCSRATLRFLQDARLPDERTFTKEALDMFARSDLARDPPPKPISPLFLEPNTQLTPLDGSEAAAYAPLSSDSEFSFAELEAMDGKRSKDMMEGFTTTKTRVYATDVDDSKNIFDLCSTDFIEPTHPSNHEKSPDNIKSHEASFFTKETEVIDQNDMQDANLSPSIAEMDMDDHTKVLSSEATKTPNEDRSELVSMAMQAVEILSSEEPIDSLDQGSVTALPAPPDVTTLTLIKRQEDNDISRYPSPHTAIANPTQAWSSTGVTRISQSAPTVVKTIDNGEVRDNSDLETVSTNSFMESGSLTEPISCHQQRPIDVLGSRPAVVETSTQLHKGPVTTHTDMQQESYQASQSKNTDGKGRSPSTHAISKSQENPHGFRGIKAEDPSAPSTFSTLGTLFTFMETRGREIKRRKVEASPYFDKPPSDPILSEISNMTIEQMDDPGSDPSHEPSFVSTHIPQITNPPKTPPLLILSTALLQSDPHLIRSLEDLSPTPRLIFRDCQTNPVGKNKSRLRGTGPDTRNRNQGEAEAEADIIVSPQTGIVLTTSQETTQMYLPGHFSSFSSSKGVDGIAQFDSPLKERTARVSLRYERVYLLIRLPPTPTPKSTASAFAPNPGTARQEDLRPITTDPKTLSCIRSLIAFSASLEENFATVIPVVVPASSSPPPPLSSFEEEGNEKEKGGELVRWICAIAAKHSPNSSSWSYNDTFRDDQTQWELFLRCAGLNPFAAQAVLVILRHDCDNQDQDHEDNNSNDNKGSKTQIVRRGGGKRGLSFFVGLSPTERKRLFEKIVGERVLERVQRVLDWNWGCFSI